MLSSTPAEVGVMKCFAIFLDAIDPRTFFWTLALREMLLNPPSPEIDNNSYAQVNELNIGEEGEVHIYKQRESLSDECLLLIADSAVVSRT